MATLGHNLRRPMVGCDTPETPQATAVANLKAAVLNKCK
jgi:hypothetical protein